MRVANLQPVLASFGLAHVSAVERLVRGTQSEKFIVGCGGRRYLLRAMHVPPPRYLEYALRLQQGVAEAGLPAPAIIATAEGTLSVSHSGTTFYMEEYLAAEQGPISLARAAACGALIGALHQAVSRRHLALPSGSAVEFEMGRWYSHVCLAAGSRFPSREPGRGFLSRTVAAAEPLSRRLRETPATQTGTHTDINPTNLWRIGRQLGFYDFSSAAPLPQVIDLALAIVGLAILDWDFGRAREILPRSLGRTPAFTAHLLAAYDRIRPLTRREKDVLPGLVPLVWLFWSYWFPRTASHSAVTDLSLQVESFAHGAIPDILSGL